LASVFHSQGTELDLTRPSTCQCYETLFFSSWLTNGPNKLECLSMEIFSRLVIVCE